MLATFQDMGFEAVWVLDFEFTTVPNDPRPQTVVCMVARDVLGGRTLRLGPDELGECPFDLSQPAIFVAFYAIAEAGCFERLGWPLPPYWLDLWVEEKRLWNGGDYGNIVYSLLESCRRYGLPIREAALKDSMRTMIGEARYTPADIPAILDYCEEDVTDTVELLEAMGPKILQSGPGTPTQTACQTIIRGRFAAECAMMTAHGIPWDVAGWERFQNSGDEVKLKLIAETEAEIGFQMYEGTTFKTNRFAEFVAARQINWPRNETTGALLLDKTTFEQQGRRRADLRHIHYLRSTLSKITNNSITWQADGRVRVNLNPFRSKTGRSQPSNSKYPFGLSKWSRCFMKPETGYTLAYLDYRSQEIMIGAALGDDDAMREAYEMGDPYMAFAIQTGQAPPNATKHTHPAERNAAKPVVLAASYGMGAYSMAERNEGMLRSEARILLERHREIYHRYWKWVEGIRLRAAMALPIYTASGWCFQIRPGSKLNERSWGNWPIQSCGSDIMRLAVIRCADAGVRPIGTVHDALVFHVPTSDADRLLKLAQREMVQAATDILGEPIAVDMELTAYPNNYSDKDGRAFFDRLTGILDEMEETARVA